MEKLRPNIVNETNPLEVVILGVANGLGPVPTIEETYDPKSKEHILAGTYPNEKDLKEEIEGFYDVLKRHGVNVLRPEVMSNCNQIFARDISFVIEDKLIVANMIEDRRPEQKAIKGILDQFDPENVIHMPDGTRAEGGDVMPWNEFIFIGYELEPDFSTYKTSRTNKAGVDFIKELFPNKKVMAFELNKSDTIAKDNALHLDCCFQPVGTDKCIIHKEGFKNVEDFEFLVNHFGKDNCCVIDKEEMYNMGSNVFSISPTTIVSERGFTRVNNQLREWGFEVEEIKYNETAKMEGLLRCSTMPIRRTDV